MPKKAKIGVVGYGTIGERIADGVALQDDMELVGVVDVAPSLPVRALVESGKGYPIFGGYKDAVPALKSAGVKVAGLLEDLLQEVDMVADATSPGIGAKNKEKYVEHGVKAVFQGGEKHEVADTLFNTMANYDAAYGKDYLKCLSCNTTGIARQAMAVDHAVGLKEMICLIIRRAADVSETHKGPVDALLPDKIPSHQATDFGIVSPHIKCITSVVTAPVCFGHATTMVFETKGKMTKDEVLDLFKANARIRIFRLEDGFLSTSHIFDYNRDRGANRGDMYEVPVWEETIYLDKGGRRLFSTNMIPQEAIVIPENIDAMRCALKMQKTWQAAFDRTNKNLGMKPGK
jgi:glyceraldehyde-3-phosphate dehydrogenase (NAD(P))